MFTTFFARISCALMALALTGTAIAETGVTDNTIVIGQTAALSGPLAGIGSAMSSGVKAHIDYVNQQGGVNGRKIKLIQMDDAYNVEKTVQNVNKLIEEEKVFALLAVMGTAQVAAAIPIAEKSRVPIYAPYTGADSLRKTFNRYQFTTSASYSREIEKMVDHLSALTVKSIGVVYLNNPFGKDGLGGADAALAKYKIKPEISFAIETNSSNIDEAVAATKKANPAVIIMVTAGKATLDFIKAYRKAGGASQFYLLSVADVETLSKGLGKEARGIVVTQTTPDPWNSSLPVVKEYQLAMQAMTKKQEYSYTSLVGYLSAKSMVEGLRATGKNLARERFIDTMERTSRQDLGGYELRFSADSHHGSTFADISMITKDGRFLR
jgi:branched-chain amino acid transport system substrate-binding protein